MLHTNVRGGGTPADQSLNFLSIHRQAYSRGTQGALHTCQGRREMLKVEGLKVLYTHVRGGGGA